MNYTLNQLKIYLKIVKCASITKAADELFISQPAVSIQLKNFQDQFDIALTEIIGRKLFVTDFGKEVAISAEKILAEVDSLNYLTQEHRGNLSGKLRLSVVSTGKYVIPYFLADFLNRHPAVELQMEVTNKAKVLESLAQNEVDMALVSILPQDLLVENIRLMQNKLFLVAKYSIEIPDMGPGLFEEHKLIYREEGSATRLCMEQFVVDNHLPVNKKIELTSNEAVKQAILAGIGISIMPLIGIKNELKDKQLRILPYQGLPILSSWNIIWMKGKKFGPVAQAYRLFLEEQKQKIISDHFSWYEAY